MHVLYHAELPLWKLTIERREKHARRSAHQDVNIACREMKIIYWQTCCLGPWRLGHPNYGRRFLRKCRARGRAKTRSVMVPRLQAAQVLLLDITPPAASASARTSDQLTAFATAAPLRSHAVRSAAGFLAPHLLFLTASDQRSHHRARWLRI